MHGGWKPIAVLQQPDGVRGGNLIAVCGDKQVAILDACKHKRAVHGFSLRILVDEWVTIRNIGSVGEEVVHDLVCSEAEPILMGFEVERLGLPREGYVRLQDHKFRYERQQLLHCTIISLLSQPTTNDKNIYYLTFLFKKINLGFPSKLVSLELVPLPHAKKVSKKGKNQRIHVMSSQTESIHRSRGSSASYVILLVQTRSPHKKVALLYVCTQPPSNPQGSNCCSD